MSTNPGAGKGAGQAGNAAAPSSAAKGARSRQVARTPARSGAGAAGARGPGGSGGSGAGASVAPGAPSGGGAWLARPFSPARIAVYALLVVVGALVGIAGALVQSAWFPGGLLLALLGLVALCVGGLYATRARAGAWSSAGGWLVVVLFLTATRPEGDFVFGSGVGSYLFLLGGMFAGVMCATVPKVPQPQAPATRLEK
ncbi:DUF6113 family protein [Streptomyces sp. 796.1]|uniref:DUF6113 family protein n=1 Tax=Streptomyces sp. 796.1 TaxID=3163029 RepID=UPI0039C997E4